jgi:hypothetical protein
MGIIAYILISAEGGASPSMANPALCHLARTMLNETGNETGGARRNEVIGGS